MQAPATKELCDWLFIMLLVLGCCSEACHTKSLESGSGRGVRECHFAVNPKPGNSSRPRRAHNRALSRKINSSIKHHSVAARLEVV